MLLSHQSIDIVCTSILSAMGRGGGEGARLDEPLTFQRGVAGKEGGETFQKVGGGGGGGGGRNFAEGGGAWLHILHEK